MTTLSARPVFPCPFCRSSSVARVGGTERLVHYRCDDCAEIWTALTLTTDAAREQRRALRQANQSRKRYA